MSLPNRPALPPGVLEALKRGDKIEAIKLMRGAAQVGLAEAKSVIDALQQAKAAGDGAHPAAAPGARALPHRPSLPHVHRPRPGLSPGQVSDRSGGGIGWLVLIVVGMVAVWWVLQ